MVHATIQLFGFDVIANDLSDAMHLGRAARVAQQREKIDILQFIVGQGQEFAQPYCAQAGRFGNGHWLSKLKIDCERPCGRKLRQADIVRRAALPPMLTTPAYEMVAVAEAVFVRAGDYMLGLALG